MGQRTEEFKRPDHPDFMTSSELAKSKFSGIRHNTIADTMECWTEGDLRVSMSATVVNTNPHLWEQELGIIFGCDIEIPKRTGNGFME